MRSHTAQLVLTFVALMSTSLSLGASPPQDTPQVSPVNATLVVPDSTLLPGVPFDMWVTVSNASDASVGVGLCGDMIVRREGGDTFVIGFGSEHGKYPTLLPERTWHGGRETYIVLRPHETKTLTIPVYPGLEGPAYFNDARLSPPGRYAMAMRLGYCWPSMVTPQKSLLPPEYLGPVTTNEALITRIQPTGVDARVWERMQELTHGQWVPTQWGTSPAGRAVVNEVTSDYPDSNYFPYMVAATMIGSASESQITRFLKTIDRFPTSPIIDLVHVAAQSVLAGNCSFHTERGVLCQRETAYLAKSSRPTTRILAFGREDLPKEPCPPEYECDN